MATDAGSGSGSGSGESKLKSTLTSACATLQGRALVNYNDNLGIAFTESDSPYAFLGSVQFELPDGFTGPSRTRKSTFRTPIATSRP